MPQVTIDQALQTAWQFYQERKLREAEAIYRQILAQQPGEVRASYGLGLLALEVRHPSAIDLIRTALPVAGNQTEVLNNLGSAYQSQGQSREALEWYRKALAVNPNSALILSNMAHALVTLGEREEAEKVSRRAIELDPNNASAYNNLGTSISATDRRADAEAAFRKALELRPDFPEALSNLGNLVHDDGRYEQAISMFRRATLLAPTLPDAYNNMSNSLRLLGRLDEAVAAARQALGLRPQFSAAHSNLGAALHQLRRFDEAIISLRQAIAIEPDMADTHVNLGLCLLLQGKFTEGWREYEWRRQSPKFIRMERMIKGPAWDGSPGRGTILVSAEQGVGDTIQFARFIRIIHQRGWRVVLHTMTSLVRLMNQSRAELQLDAVVPWTEDNSEKLPPFDAHCPLASLPVILGQMDPDSPSIPRPPYLRVDVALQAAWRDRLRAQVAPGTRTVGLVWAGRPSHMDDRNRSIPLARWAPLAVLASRGVRFVSLQIGPAADQAKNPPPGLNLLDLTADIEDFADTAALVGELDMIVTVDTATAHLAGALGRPASVLLPWVPDFRWLLDRSDTPWYPSLRLYRQPGIGQWEPVIDQLVADLGRDLSR
jgi:tetratricopeptide (TPR) repeat protein